jgi:hypothetical protein
MKTLLLVAALSQLHPYNTHNWGFATLFTVDFKGEPTRVIGGCHTKRWALVDIQNEKGEWEAYTAIPGSVMDNWIDEACSEPLDNTVKQYEDWL